MDFELENNASERALTLRGRLTFQENEDFRRIVDQLATQTRQALTVDMSDLDFIDSAGLGMLIVLNEVVEGRVTLSGQQGQVKRLLTASRFHTLMSIVD